MISQIFVSFCPLFAQVQTVTIDEDEGELELDEVYREKLIAVPLTVSIVILSVYTLIGAVLFPQWEDWSLADSAYFSFITISTIGFGDLVPGTGRLAEVSLTFDRIIHIHLCTFDHTRTNFEKISRPKYLSLAVTTTLSICMMRKTETNGNMINNAF